MIVFITLLLIIVIVIKLNEKQLPWEQMDEVDYKFAQFVRENFTLDFIVTFKEPHWADSYDSSDGSTLNFRVRNNKGYLIVMRSYKDSDVTIYNEEDKVIFSDYNIGIHEYIMDLYRKYRDTWRLEAIKDKPDYKKDSLKYIE